MRLCKCLPLQQAFQDKNSVNFLSAKTVFILFVFSGFWFSGFLVFWFMQ